ncbi:MAG: DUF4139 domain-containing protein [Spirochaetaceae bacterium]|jgi:hypothetical protein|nr:DUF4139 domain-containing protein [Spirochaetaceae bacterium]
MRRIVLILLAFVSVILSAAEPQKLPLKRISLFSSGVGYFEHTGAIEGNALLSFSFTRSALNDALKSLVVNDVESGSPQINYLSDTTLQRTLQSLKIDLSGNPGLLDILRSLKGIEIIAQVKNASGTMTSEARGKIIAVEMRGEAGESWPVLSLSTASGVRNIGIAQLVNFSFTDISIQNDLSRALDLISKTGAARIRELDIELSGRRKREVTVSYVIPTPVWKISYRLDLNQSPPLLQSWAIIDNDGDVDWDGVEVSLVSGRPVSFVQSLYPPYYTARPVLPLAGVGIAEAQTHESGWDYDERETAVLNESAAPMPAAENAYFDKAAPSLKMSMADSTQGRQAKVMGSGGAAAQARIAGEQFEWTLKKPVVLQRQRSAMLPLFDGSVSARKLILFSGERALGAGTINVSAGVEVTNSTGQKLPSGSMTVFDGGTYAGDALVDFMSNGEKRLVTYGEDLSVSGSVRAEQNRVVDTAKLSRGMFVLNRKRIFQWNYTIRNSSAETKRLVIEHPVTAGTKLAKPSEFSEKTATLYRFEMDLSANQVLIFDVNEEMPVTEQYALSNLNGEALLVWTNNAELPENIRKALREALALKTAAETARKKTSALEAQRTFLVSEQERIRANLQAAGNATAEGQNYLAMLTSLDKDISSATDNINAARATADSAQSDYEAYISSLEL